MRASTLALTAFLPLLSCNALLGGELGAVCATSSDCDLDLTCESAGPVVGQCTAGCDSDSFCQKFSSKGWCNSGTGSGSNPVNQWKCVQRCSNEVACPSGTSCNGVWCQR